MAHKIFIDKLGDGVFRHKIEIHHNEGYIITKCYGIIDQDYLYLYEPDGLGNGGRVNHKESKELGKHKIVNVVVNGNSFTDYQALALYLKSIGHIIFEDVSPSGTTTTTTTNGETIWQTPTGEIVIRQINSDGTITFINQDGTPYLGDTTLLLPYTAQGEFILFSHTPSVLNNGQNEIVDVAVVGAVLGTGYVTLTTNLTAFQNTSVNSFVIADDLVRIIIVNNTGGTINLPQLDFKYIK